MSIYGFCWNEREHRNDARRDARYGRKDREEYDRYSDDPCKQAYTEEYDREHRREEDRREEARQEEAGQERARQHAAEQIRRQQEMEEQMYYDEQARQYPPEEFHEQPE